METVGVIAVVRRVKAKTRTNRLPFIFFFLFVRGTVGVEVLSYIADQNLWLVWSYDPSRYTVSCSLRFILW